MAKHFLRCNGQSGIISFSFFFFKYLFANEEEQQLAGKLSSL